MDSNVALCLDKGRNVTVEACAGSGKTWLLTSRIIRILLESPGMPHRQVLAITFTNNAVEQIRERIRQRLSEMASASDERLASLLAELGAADSPEIRRRARILHREFVLQRPQLSVYTFHSWFSHLIQFLPWDDQPAPGGQAIANEAELREQAWEETLGAVVGDAELERALQMLLGTAKLSRLKEILDTMLDKRLEWYLYYKMKIEDEQMPRRFQESLDEDQPRPAGQTPEELFANEGFRERLENLAELAAAIGGRGMKSEFLPQALSASSASQAFENAQKFFDTTGKAASPDLIGVARQERKAVRRAREEDPDFAAAAAAVMTPLRMAVELGRWKKMRAFNLAAARLGSAYARSYERVKRSLGMIDYNDMELYPMFALFPPSGGDGAFVEDSGRGMEMLRRMDMSYRHILVDEFQDTSAGQWQILQAWLEASASGDNQPSVFLVGDQKQSIYGFRGGNPHLLRVARDYLAEKYDGVSVTFDTTRRCSQAVVDVVNEVFLALRAPAAGEPDGDGGFKEHATLRTELAGSVEVVHPAELEKSEGEEKPAGMRNPLEVPRPQSDAELLAEEEGERISLVLKRMLAHTAVRGDDGQERPCRIDDIMLLYPKRTHVAAMAAAMARNGIPCMSPDQTNRLHDLECQDIIALLHAIHDPGYGLAVAHVLRSPIFSIAEDDLQAVFSGGGGDWVKGLAKAQGSGALTRAQEMLASWRRAYSTGKLPAHEMLAKCFHDSDLVQRYVRATPAGKRKRVVQNLEWLLNLAIEAAGGRYAQLASFASHLRKLAALSSLDISSDQRHSGMLSLRTVHGAKGLESPIVVMANAQPNDLHEHTRLLVSWDFAGAGARPAHISFVVSNGEATSVQRRWVDFDLAGKERERNNMLYVAMTRAKQHLVVSCRSQKKKSSQFKWLDEISAGVDALDGRKRQGTSVYAVEGAAPMPQEEKAADSAPPAATELVAPAPGAVPQTGRARRHAGVKGRRGTLLHDLLALRIAGVDDASAQRRFLTVDESERLELMQASEAIMGAGTEFGSLLQGSDQVDVELPVIDEDGRALRIDCLLAKGDELWVLDFKTGAGVETPDNLEQVRKYREIVAEARGGGRVRCALVDAAGALTEVS